MDNEKLLYGLSSTHIIEMDDEEYEQLKDRAEMSYDINTVVDSIGTETFKETFLNFINSIRNYPFDIQEMTASKILLKIQDIYNYEFSPAPEVTSLVEVNRVFDLIIFLEYDFINFISSVWKRMNVDLSKIDVTMFCQTNQKRITNSIDKVVLDINFSKMSDGLLTKIFLRTYYRDGLISLFQRMTNKEKSLILLRIMEG